MLLACCLCLIIGFGCLSTFMSDVVFYYSARWEYVLDDGLFRWADVGDLMTALVFLGVGIFLAVKLFKKPHVSRQRYKTWMWIFFAIMCCGLIGSDWGYAPDVAEDVTLILCFAVLALLMYFYNKTGTAVVKQEAVQEQAPEPVKTPVPEAPKEMTLSELMTAAARTPTAQANPAFVENLKKSQAFLYEIEKSQLKISPHFLAQVKKLLITFLDVEDNAIQTEKSRSILNEIMGAFPSVEEALGCVYDNQCDSQSMDIETDIKTMEMKLKVDGLLKGDFKQ